MTVLQASGTSQASATFSTLPTAMQNFGQTSFTMAAVVKLGTLASGQDLLGVTPNFSATSNVAGELGVNTSSQIAEDDNNNQHTWSTGAPTLNTTDWWLIAVAGTVGGTMNCYAKDLTTNGSWVIGTAPTNIIASASLGSTGSITIGNFASGSQLFGWTATTWALVGLWASVALSSAQIQALATNKRTSDWWNNAGGRPDALVECANASSAHASNAYQYDIGNNPSAYVSSTNMSLVTDTSSWTFDSQGSGAPQSITAGTAIEADTSSAVSITQGGGAITVAQIEYHYSGSGTPANPELSLGGAIAAGTVTSGAANNVWKDVTDAERQSGKDYYTCLYVKQTHPSDLWRTVTLWIDDPEDQGTTSIGLDPQPIGGTATTVANVNTVPTGVTFASPTTKGAGTVIGDIPAGSWKSFWEKRSFPAAGSASASDAISIRCEGDSTSY